MTRPSDNLAPGEYPEWLQREADAFAVTTRRDRARTLAWHLAIALTLLAGGALGGLTIWRWTHG